MIKIRILYISCFLAASILVNAQNTLWLTNGKKITIKEFKLDNKEFVIYQNQKGKSKSIERFDVFSIIENSKNEIVIYQPDSSYEDAFNLLEMKAFVQGQYDASQKFKSPLTTIGGIAVAGGASSGIIAPVYVLVVSGVYCGAIGVTKPSKKKIIIPQEYTNSDHYLLGYKKVTKHKRIKNAIIGSVIGLAAGFTTFAIINK